MTAEHSMIAVAGMHRSGTSLLASWLQACGLDLGSDLFGPTYGNPRGHFEDKRFIELQQSWLEAEGVDFTLKENFRASIKSNQLEEARLLTAERQGGSATWGWKDPRTSLFLELWKEAIPDLQVIAIYRDWRQVVASLMRRDRRQPAGPLKSLAIPLWHQPKNRPLANSYLQTWIAYNRSIVDYARSHSLLLLTVDVLQNQDQAVFKALNSWASGLVYAPFSELYHPQDWHGESSEPSVTSALRDAADDLLNELHSLSFSRKTTQSDPAS